MWKPKTLSFRLSAVQVNTPTCKLYCINHKQDHAQISLRRCIDIHPNHTNIMQICRFPKNYRKKMNIYEYIFTGAKNRRHKTWYKSSKKYGIICMKSMACKLKASESCYASQHLACSKDEHGPGIWHAEAITQKTCIQILPSICTTIKMQWWKQTVSQ